MPPIESQEVVYRCVIPLYVVWDGAEWRLSTQAFNDRGMKPSVDIGSLRPEPADTKLSSDDGIAQLVTGEIRENVKLVQNPNAKLPEAAQYYEVVVHRPIVEPHNPAHAQVEAAPEIASGSHFKKMKDALCRLAERRGWVIEPIRP